MAKSKIEWTEYSWNPVTGCTPVSEGCQNCYAKRMAKRLRGRCGYPADDPFRVTLHPERLEEPLKWKKPRRVFVCSMGDLFHEDVHPYDIMQIFNVMAKAKQHTFLVLTKRPERMLEFYKRLRPGNVIPGPYFSITGIGEGWAGSPPVLPDNIWLGVTAENQQRADERIPILLQIPATVRFVSCEPLLSAIDLTKWLGGKNINDGCRKTILCPNGDRGIQYFTNRRDLETQRADRECQRCESEVERNPDEKSRNNAKPGPFKSSNDREWQESNGLCSSCSMDVLQQGRNTGSFGDKPQRRESKEQSSRQLGVGDQEREYLACGAGVEALGQEGTTRGEEFKCKTYSPTGYRNTVDLEEPRDVLITNSGTLQSVCDDNTGYLPSENMETSFRGINWCIVGGETGPGARPMHPDWVRSLRDQCQDAGISFFLKSWGEYCFPSQMPEETYQTLQDRYNLDVEIPWKVGKKAAGRFLDGRTWDEMPKVEG